MAQVRFNNNEFLIQIKETWDARGSKSPESYKQSGIYHLPVNTVNAQYLKEQFKPEEMSDNVRNKIAQVLAENELIERKPYPYHLVEFKNPPRDHQKAALDHSYGLREAAWFMEMRTGKSWTAIHDAVGHYVEGDINAALVICLTPNKPVWELQFEEHCPIDFKLHVHYAGAPRFLKETRNFIKKETHEGEFKIFVVGVESLSQGNAYKYVDSFCKNHKVAIYVDESDAIKTPDSKRTERCIDAGGYSEYRRILTGTEITQGMQDLYSQFRFLNWRIIGMKSYFAFRARYCVMGGFEGRHVVGYINTNELMDHLRPYVYRVDAKDVIKQVPHVFEKRIVEPNSEQKRLIKELGDPFKLATSIGDLELEVETVLERMTRYMQIAGGHFPFETDDGYDQIPIPGISPKLEALKSVVEEIRPEDKIIIWARFRPEIELIKRYLGPLYGYKSIVEYHGGTPQSERRGKLEDFQKKDHVRFFVTNQQTGARGLELSAANVHIFYSNSFSYAERKQAMARTNSSQQTKPVLYVDIILKQKIDFMIHDALDNKKSMADYVRSQLR